MAKYMILFMLLAAAVWSDSRPYLVTGSAVNIRSEGSEKSKVITAVSKNSIVEIFERDEKPAVVKVAGVEGSWLQEAGTGGYIFSAFVQPADPSFKIAVRNAADCMVSEGYLDCGPDFGGKRKLASNVVILMAQYSPGFEKCCKGARPTLIQKGATSKKIILTHMMVNAIVNAENEVVTITGDHPGHGCD